MARGEDTGGHPGRQVHAARFGLGDIVHVPDVTRFGRTTPGGPIRITGMDKNYFWGVRPTGESYGKTGIGLSEGQGMTGAPQPWRIEHQGTIPEED